MAGTAVTAAVWLMLEYTGPWAAKATEDNELPDEAAAWLGEQVKTYNGRLQFIRQFRPAPDILTFFIGVNRETSPRLYEFHLGAYEDLLELDIAAVLHGDRRYEPHRVTGQRYFICTNGKRDRSCGLHGAALYRVLAQKAGSSVWMTTHLGGHRFAATLLALPDGICYGRVRPHDVSQMLMMTSQGKLWPEKVRGRTCYGSVEQVADHALRQETGQLRQDAFKWVETVIIGDGRWQVQFRAKEGQLWQLTVATAAPVETYVNSGTWQSKPITHYHIIDIITNVPQHLPSSDRRPGSSPV